MYSDLQCTISHRVVFFGGGKNETIQPHATRTKWGESSVSSFAPINGSSSCGGDSIDIRCHVQG